MKIGDGVEILFTCMSKNEEKEIKELAKKFGYKVVSKVTPNITYLCKGNKGSIKPIMQKRTIANGGNVITRARFLKDIIHTI